MVFVRTRCTREKPRLVLPQLDEKNKNKPLAFYNRFI